MYHLPRNPDGTMMTSRLTESGSLSGPSDSAEVCEFECPGDYGFCIPRRLVCNGVVNCPNVTLGVAEEGSGGGGGGSVGVSVGGVGVSDESPELCKRSEADAVNWLGIGLGAAAGAILAVSCLVILCRLCFCHKRAGDHEDDVDVPY
jgi:hypothetical protein